MSASDLERFAYVDTAVGGEDHRNHVMRPDQFRPPVGAAGTYQTYLLYDAGLPAHAREMRKTEGRPTVRGYRGPALATFLPFDVDRDDPAEALAVARRIFLGLVHRWDIPPEAIRVTFSGGKGYHHEVPSSLCGGFAPGVDVPDRLKRLALALVGGLTVELDLSIYSHLRLWRVVNSKHQKSGRYAVPLTADEFLNLDLPAIVALAGAPRELAAVPDDEWEARPELVALWQATTRADGIGPRGAAEPLPERITAGSGRRHSALVSLAGTLRHRGLGARTIAKMLAAFNDEMLDPPAPDADVERIAEDIAGYPVDGVPPDRLLLATARAAASKAARRSASECRIVELGDVRRPEASLLTLAGGLLR